MTNFLIRRVVRKRERQGNHLAIEVEIGVRCVRSKEHQTVTATSRSQAEASKILPESERKYGPAHASRTQNKFLFQAGQFVVLC